MHQSQCYIYQSHTHQWWVGEKYFGSNDPKIFDCDVTTAYRNSTQYRRIIVKMRRKVVSNIFVIVLFCQILAITSLDFQPSSVDLTSDSIANNRVDNVPVRPPPEQFPKHYRMFVKDWVVQWDPLYRAWFYYHTPTGFKNLKIQVTLSENYVFQTSAPGRSLLNYSIWHWNYPSLSLEQLLSLSLNT